MKKSLVKLLAVMLCLCSALVLAACGEDAQNNIDPPLDNTDQPSADTPTEPEKPTEPEQPSEPDVPTDPAQPDDLEPWKIAYFNYLNELKDNKENCEFRLVHIDSDDIPELFISGSCEAAGSRVCSYKNGQAIEVVFNRKGGGSFIPESGLLRNSNGNMGNYHTNIYRLTDRGFISVLSAFEEEYQEEVTDSTGTFWEIRSRFYLYDGPWSEFDRDGELAEVTEQEFEKMEASVYDFRISKKLSEETTDYITISEQIKSWSAPAEEEKPIEPEKPTEPETPGEPDVPSEPEQPTEPEKPKDKPYQYVEPTDNDTVINVGEYSITYGELREDIHKLEHWFRLFYEIEVGEFAFDSSTPLSDDALLVAYAALAEESEKEVGKYSSFYVFKEEKVKQVLDRYFKDYTFKLENTSLKLASYYYMSYAMYEYQTSITDIKIDGNILTFTMVFEPNECLKKQYTLEFYDGGYYFVSVTDDLTIKKYDQEAVTKITNVLLSKEPYFNTSTHKNTTIKENCQGAWTFSVVDIDGDSFAEIAIEMWRGCYPSSYLILKYDNGKVYGSTRVIRAWNEPRVNGVATGSGGASYTQYYHYYFEDGIMKEDGFAHTGLSDNYQEEYYVGNEKVSVEEFDAVTTPHEYAPEIIFAPLNEKNIRRALDPILPDGMSVPDEPEIPDDTAPLPTDKPSLSDEMLEKTADYLNNTTHQDFENIISASFNEHLLVKRADGTVWGGVVNEDSNIKLISSDSVSKLIANEYGVSVIEEDGTFTLLSGYTLTGVADAEGLTNNGWVLMKDGSLWYWKYKGTDQDGVQQREFVKIADNVKECVGAYGSSFYYINNDDELMYIDTYNNENNETKLILKNVADVNGTLILDKNGMLWDRGGSYTPKQAMAGVKSIHDGDMIITENNSLCKEDTLCYVYSSEKIYYVLDNVREVYKAGYDCYYAITNDNDLYWLDMEFMVSTLLTSDCKILICDEGAYLVKYIDTKGNVWILDKYTYERTLMAENAIYAGGLDTTTYYLQADGKLWMSWIEYGKVCHKMVIDNVLLPGQEVENPAAPETPTDPTIPETPIIPIIPTSPSDI